MKKFLAFILSLSMVIVVPAQIVYAKDNKKSEPTAKSSVLMCLETGDVIKENNSHERLSPASVTKIMSILLIIESIDSGKIKLDDMVSASENAVSKGGSQIWLEVGEKMSVNDLLKAVIIASANDACTLLGEYIAGSDSAFVDMMNKKCRELGLKDTNFENCTGLDDEVTNHYSSAYDLAVIAREVMKHDLVTEYSTVWLDSLRNGETELNNTNKLVNTYSGITGLKTGTTSNAGFCLCATAKRDNMGLVSVVLGADNSEDRFSLSSQLLDYGFANYKLEKLNVDKKKIKSVKVKNGVIKSIKPAVSNQEYVLMEKSSSEVTCKYNAKKELHAPVKKGDKIGEIVYYSDSKKIASISLNADCDIKKTSFSYILKQLFKYM
ncbi:MAG: D-alanyl-D-alanine carboxypeptidase [Acetobacter sp.]|nr:D-alanyl-D-alanine carboxypeptidase [Bacteroides sp.]MCM1340538.1 D-alanyl-D-alanine carboxypeptidase [Acetobacter sp.]MCM1433278.1 D-alanyl-D-alanine carboxypeptidase [Clostridiales bacterium]